MVPSGLVGFNIFYFKFVQFRKIELGNSSRKGKDIWNDNWDWWGNGTDFLQRCRDWLFVNPHKSFTSWAVSKSEWPRVTSTSYLWRGYLVGCSACFWQRPLLCFVAYHSGHWLCKIDHEISNVIFIIFYSHLYSRLLY